MLLLTNNKKKGFKLLNKSKFVVGCIKARQKCHSSCDYGSGSRWRIGSGREFYAIKIAGSDFFKTI